MKSIKMEFTQNFGFLTCVGIFILFPMGFVYADPNLTSLAITPANPSIDIGFSQQLTAVATYDDGSERLLGGNTWSEMTPLPNQRRCAGVASLRGIIYVIGGLDTSKSIFGSKKVATYNPKTGQWSRRTSLPDGVACPQVEVDEINEIIYVIGEQNVCEPNCIKSYGNLYAYELATNTWTKKSSVPQAVNTYATAIMNGTLYTFGGDSGYNENVVLAYDPSTDTWNPRAATTPFISDAASAIAFKDKIYVMGGNTARHTVKVYDPINDIWEEDGASIPGADGWYLSIEVIDDRLYVLGFPYSSNVHAYDPASDAWTSMAELPVQTEFGYSETYGQYRGYATAMSNGILYALNTGGNSSENGSLWAFAPPEAQWSSDNAEIAQIDGAGLAQATATAGSTVIAASVGAVSASTILTTLPQPLYSLTVSSNSDYYTYGDIYWSTDYVVSSGSCVSCIPQGVTVTIVGYSYSNTPVKWFGACEGQGPVCTIVMDSDKETYGKFKVIPY